MLSERQKAIKELIDTGRIGTQAELLALLRERGYDATQATLSRDLRRIGAQKDEYYYIAEAPELPPLTRSSLISADHAMNTAVLRCRAGTANAVCAEFDAMRFENVVGTIAGDDTIFVLMRTEKDAARLCALIEAELS